MSIPFLNKTWTMVKDPSDVVAVTGSGTSASPHIHNIDLSTGNNFIMKPGKAGGGSAVSAITFTITDQEVGQSGSIMISNLSAGTISFKDLASSVYTPSGSAISWETANSKDSLMSYYVANTTKILVNYIGDFGSYPSSNPM